MWAILTAKFRRLSSKKQKEKKKLSFTEMHGFNFSTNRLFYLKKPKSKIVPTNFFVPFYLANKQITQI